MRGRRKRRKGQGGLGPRGRGSLQEGRADGGELQRWKHWTGDPYRRRACKKTEMSQSIPFIDAEYV